MRVVSYTEDIPNPTDYLALFETTGWNATYQANADELRTALRSSWKAVAAYDGAQLVGFGRVVSDGVLYGMIYDVIVMPSHQHGGIGSEIVRRLVGECRRSRLRAIHLFSAKGTKTFYEGLGFTQRPDDAPGMTFTGRR